MDQEEKIQTEYEEIDLMDYVKVLLKRKWLILAVFLGAAIVVGIYSFILPKIYKIDTALEVGRVAGIMVEDPAQVVEKLKGDVYGIFVREKLEIPEEKYPKIKTENPKETNLITLVIESAKPPESKNILEEINNLILEEHQEKIKVKKELIEMNIKTVEGQIEIIKSNIEKVKNKKQSSENDIQRIKNKIETIREDIESTRNKIQPLRDDITRVEIKIGNAEEEKTNLEAKVEALQKVLPYQQDPGTQFALFDAKEKLANKKQEIENLYLQINSLKRTIEDYNLQTNSLERTIEDYNSQINSLERGSEDYKIQINALESAIEDYRSQINSLRASLDDIRPTRVVKSPTVSASPIKPRPLLNTVIAAVLGLFIGVFLAFFQEWWEKNKV